MEKQNSKETFYRVCEIDENGDAQDQTNFECLKDAETYAYKASQWDAVIIEKVHRSWKDYGATMEEESETIKTYGNLDAIKSGGWERS